MRDHGQFLEVEGAYQGMDNRNREYGRTQLTVKGARGKGNANILITYPRSLTPKNVNMAVGQGRKEKT